MKMIFLLTITCFIGAALCAVEHPAEEAASKLKEAQKKYDLAETELRKAIQLIGDKEKRDAALEALNGGAEAWDKVSEFEIKFKMAATAAPETATSVGLIPYRTDALFLNYRAEQLSEHARWVRAMWQK
jgi:hypothetical protein